MRGLIPHPVLSAALAVMWLALTAVTPGHLILGTLVALLAGWAVERLQPGQPKVRRWDLVVRLTAITAWDILLSNISVAQLILSGGRHGRRHSGFVEVELRLRSRPALAWLAVIITATPGTAWVAWDPGRGRLLMHIFDLKEPAHWQHVVRDRYESLLLEIFP